MAAAPKMGVCAEPCLRAGASGCKTKVKSSYSAGGARGAVCEKTGPAAGIMSSGNGKEATGFNKETDGATSNCAGI